jgi:pyrophosphatase PpaX
MRLMARISAPPPPAKPALCFPQTAGPLVSARICPRVTLLTMTHPARTRKRVAIFDLDGTLVDSMPFVIEAFTHAVEPFRARPTPTEVLAELGGPLGTCVRNLLGPLADKDAAAAMERLLSFERGQELRMTPFAGARGLLAALKEKGVGMGIWTGRDRWSAERILDVHGMAGFFTATVCGDDLESHKPDPAGLLRAVDLLGATAKEAVFLGDADADVLGGHAAGVHTIFVHHGRAAPAHIQSQAAEVFAEPAEAYAAVARHFP